MAKNKSKHINKNNIALVILILGIISAVVLALNAFNIAAEANDEVATNGLKLAFGGDIFINNVSIGKLNFNISFVLILVLPIIAGIIQLLINNKLGSLISLVLFVISVVLLLTVKEAQLTTTFIVVIKTKLNVSLLALGYVSLISSVLGAGLAAYKMI